MLSSLPCFYAFCWSAIPTSCYIFNVFYSCTYYILYIHTHIHAHAHTSTHTPIPTNINANTHKLTYNIKIYTYMHVHIHAHPYKCSHTCKHIHTCNINAYMYTCVSTYMNMHTRAHVHTYTCSVFWSIWSRLWWLAQPWRIFESSRATSENKRGELPTPSRGPKRRAGRGGEREGGGDNESSDAGKGSPQWWAKIVKQNIWCLIGEILACFSFIGDQSRSYCEGSTVTIWEISCEAHDNVAWLNAPITSL